MVSKVKYLNLDEQTRHIYLRVLHHFFTSAESRNISIVPVGKTLSKINKELEELERSKEDGSEKLD